MITSITAITNVEVAPAAEPTMLQALVDGLTFPLTAKTDQRMNITGTRYVALAYGAVGMVIGSKATRSRLANDPSAPPILSVFF